MDPRVLEEQERWRELNTIFKGLPDPEKNIARMAFFRNYKSPFRDRVKALEDALMTVGIIVTEVYRPAKDVTADGAAEYEEIMMAREIMDGSSL